MAPSGRRDGGQPGPAVLPAGGTADHRRCGRRRGGEGENATAVVSPTGPWMVRYPAPAPRRPQPAGAGLRPVEGRWERVGAADRRQGGPAGIPAAVLRPGRPAVSAGRGQPEARHSRGVRDGCHRRRRFPDEIRRRAGAGGLRRAAAVVVDGQGDQDPDQRPRQGPGVEDAGRQRPVAGRAGQVRLGSGAGRPDAVGQGPDGAGPAEDSAGAGARPMGAAGRRRDQGGRRPPEAAGRTGHRPRSGAHGAGWRRRPGHRGDRRRGLDRRSAGPADRPGADRRSAPAQGAGRHPAALSGSRLRLAGLPAPLGAGRLPRRRHGPGQDDPDAGPDPARPGDGAGKAHRAAGLPDFGGRQLAAGGGALHARVSRS